MQIFRTLLISQKSCFSKKLKALTQLDIVAKGPDPINKLNVYYLIASNWKIFNIE